MVLPPFPPLFYFVFWLILSLNNFESWQVGSRVTGNYKHAASTLSISELSDMPRRTPKKPLMTAEQEETDCLHQYFFNHVGHNQSCDLLNTAMIEETEERTECFKTPKVTRQLPLSKVKLPSRTQEVNFLNATG